MKLTINAVATKMGGASTYLRNVLPELVEQFGSRLEHPLVVWGDEGLAPSGAWRQSVQFRRHEVAAHGGLRRIMFDQVDLPRMLRRERQDVLFSSGSLGPLRCPCRHIVLVRNPVYFHRLYVSRMRHPAVRLRMYVERWLTLRAVASADHVLFPTRAMLDMVAAYTKGPRATWSVAPYGVRTDLAPAPDAATRPDGSPVRLLHVSHYCDQKNLGVLFRALLMLDERLPGKFHLTLTSGLESLRERENPHCPSLREDRELLRKLSAKGLVSDLGNVPYQEIPDLYRSADVFVFPSYTESFGHPLVEAMASGLPVVAAGEDVNREMCGEAGVYVPTFEASPFADAIAAIALSVERRRDLRALSLRRAADFSWRSHVAGLVQAMDSAPVAALDGSLGPLRSSAIGPAQKR